MQSLRIKRWREPSEDANAKADLRAYVDELPIDQQRSFVALASALIDTRRNIHAFAIEASQRRTMLELQH